MGTVSPVVAKLAVDRLKQFRRTGTAIGEVYAWGMVGSIIGTFLTGFVLINFLGTKGVILVLGTLLAFCATFFGPTWHAIWAGIPLGSVRNGVHSAVARRSHRQAVPAVRRRQAHSRSSGTTVGIREEKGDLENPRASTPGSTRATTTSSRSNNKRLDNGELTMRTLVLDNLIHGYFMLGHPERLDYDYEHIYAMVAYRAAKASGKLTMAEPAEAARAGRERAMTRPGRRASQEAGPASRRTEERRRQQARERAQGNEGDCQARGARRASERAGRRRRPGQAGQGTPRTF